MKLVIEVDQQDENRPPVVRLLVDDQPIGLIERLEFEANVAKALPRCSVRMPSIDALALSPEMRTTIQDIKVKIGQYRKLLGFFRSWLEVL